MVCHDADAKGFGGRGGVLSHGWQRREVKLRAEQRAVAHPVVVQLACSVGGSIVPSKTLHNAQASSVTTL